MFVNKTTNSMLNKSVTKIKTISLFKRYASLNVSTDSSQLMAKKFMVDLRSDTLSMPTQKMRSIMSTIEVGDDVWNEDPTIHSLQNRMAKIFNKESSLFVPSGTMGNLISTMVHCNDRYSEMIVGNYSHIHQSEGGNSAFIAGIHSCVLQNQSNGTINLNQIEENIKQTDDPHSPKTKLICLENSHNRCGGTVLSKEYMDDVCNIGHSNDIPIHLDGARIFNSAISLGYNMNTINEYVKNIDSINICFSKGLSSPVGSIILGNNEFINIAKRYRKALGGGMRQSGILAGCCLVSLDEIVPILYQSHDNCQYLNNKLNKLNINGLKIIKPMTNILIFTINKNEGFPFDDLEFHTRLQDEGILIHHWSKNTFRMVLYHGIDTSDVDKVIEAFKNVLDL